MVVKTILVFILCCMLPTLSLALIIDNGAPSAVPLRSVQAKGKTVPEASTENRAAKRSVWRADPQLEKLVERRIAAWKADTLSRADRRPINNISRWISNVSAYREYIMDAALKYDIDETFLTALFAWESGGNPKARSIKRARGFGQFVKITAAEKGLVVNNIIDERLDPAKSIDAAASYLSDAAKRYKKYRFLVTAYYNYGPGNLRKKIKKYGLNESLFYKLPKETKEHYINIFAIKKLIDESERYGFSYEVKPCHKQIIEKSRPYVVKTGEDLSTIAKKNGVDVKMILWKNPKIINPEQIASGIVIKI